MDTSNVIHFLLGLLLRSSDNLLSDNSVSFFTSNEFVSSFSVILGIFISDFEPDKLSCGVVAADKDGAIFYHHSFDHQSIQMTFIFYKGY